MIWFKFHAYESDNRKKNQTYALSDIELTTFLNNIGL